jgi:hypothetical protein
MRREGMLRVMAVPALAAAVIIALFWWALHQPTTISRHGRKVEQAVSTTVVSTEALPPIRRLDPQSVQAATVDRLPLRATPPPAPRDSLANRASTPPINEPSSAEFVGPVAPLHAPALLSPPVVSESEELAGLALAPELPFEAHDTIDAIPAAAPLAPRPPANDRPINDRPINDAGADDASSRAPSVQAWSSDRPWPSIASAVRTHEFQPPSPWPLTPSLDRSLSELQRFDEASAWATRVLDELDSLRQTSSSLNDPNAAGNLALLQREVDDGVRWASDCEGLELQRQWMRAALGLKRRVELWSAVVEAVAQPSNRLIAHRSAIGLIDAIEAVEQRLQPDPGNAAWRSFLLLEELRRAASSGTPQHNQILAQRALLRFQWHGLSADQQRFIQEPSLIQLADALRPIATGPVDYASLLQSTERCENDSISLDTNRMAGAMQSLQFSSGDAPARVASAIHTQYRNANVRLAVHRKLIEQFLPPIPAQSKPVRQSMFGARVRGTSETEAKLDVQLVPAKDAWQLQLLVNGQVASRTQSSSGPAVLHATGLAQFQTAGLIRIDRHGVGWKQDQVQVAANNRVGRIGTDYDGIPLIGDLVQAVAMEQYEQNRCRAQRRTEQLVSDEIRSELDQQLGSKIDQAKMQFTQQLLGPLARMQLHPEVVDLETTNDRLLVRYRLASPWQLAAFTPRPRAPADSWLSLQIHQSSINNAFAGLGLGDAPLPLPVLARRLLDTFEQQAVAVPEDLPEEVTVQFAPARPITCEIEDGRLWLTLRVVSLRQPGKIDLRFFVIRAPYTPVVDGLSASLQREGTINIGGQRQASGDRLVLRTLFNKVLARERTLPLISQRMQSHPAAQTLAVSQLELRDGWLAVAISPKTTESTSR